MMIKARKLSRPQSLVILLFGLMGFWLLGSAFHSGTLWIFGAKDKSDYLQNCDRVTKPNIARKLNDVWYNVRDLTVKNCEINVYGAYYDDRIEVNDNLFIRIFAVATCEDSAAVFCQLWSDNNSVIVVKADDMKIGRGYKINEVFYMERLYSCRIHEAFIPEHVTLTLKPCSNSSTSIPITFPSKSRTHEFGVCVAVAYGKLDPKRLVEWIEFNRILGVKEINVYNSRLNKEAANVFDAYKNISVVNHFPAAPPMEYWCVWCQKLATLSVLNDCMYRNMYRYNFTIIIDFDEFIIPKIDDSYKSLVNRLAQNLTETAPSFMFRNGYFFTDYGKRGDSSALMTMSYTNRLPPSKPGYSAKSFVNPRKCIVMQNHYCIKRTPDVSTRDWTVPVNELIALSHHYKKCHYGQTQCRRDMKQRVSDESALRFKNKLAPIL